MERSSIWYKKNNEGNKFIKLIPLNISEILSEIFLAFWIQVDGYFYSYGRAKTVILFTDSFIEEECIIFQSLLEKLDIKSTHPAVRSAAPSEKESFGPSPLVLMRSNPAKQSFGSEGFA